MTGLTPKQLRILQRLSAVGQETALNQDVPTYRNLRQRGFIVICDYASHGNPFYTITASGREALKITAREA